MKLPKDLRGSALLAFETTIIVAASGVVMRWVLSHASFFKGPLEFLLSSSSALILSNPTLSALWIAVIVVTALLLLFGAWLTPPTMRPLVVAGGDTVEQPKFKLPDRLEWRRWDPREIFLGNGKSSQHRTTTSRATRGRARWPDFLRLVPLILIVLLAGPLALYLVWFLSVAVHYLVRLVIAYNFTACAVLVALILSGTLFPDALKRQSWKRMDTVWLKIPAFGSLTAMMSFGVLAFASKVGEDSNFAALGLKAGQLSRGALLVAFGSTMGLWLLAFLTTTAGRSRTPDEESQVPLTMFVAAFACVWLANLGTYTIALNGLFLTLYAGLVAA